VGGARRVKGVWCKKEPRSGKGKKNTRGKKGRGALWESEIEVFKQSHLIGSFREQDKEGKTLLERD